LAVLSQLEELFSGLLSLLQIRSDAIKHPESEEYGWKFGGLADLKAEVVSTRKGSKDLMGCISPGDEQ
jgi:hypothetical protein